MFPAGAAGYGLLILRLCAAGMLMRSVTDAGDASYFSCSFLLVAVVIFLLGLGLFTPLCCVASILGQIAMRSVQVDRDVSRLAFSLALTVALLLLGPGALSFDSQLFGRRLITRSK